jgi:hypothetical protein
VGDPFAAATSTFSARLFHSRVFRRKPLLPNTQLDLSHTFADRPLMSLLHQCFANSKTAKFLLNYQLLNYNVPSRQQDCPLKNFFSQKNLNYTNDTIFFFGNKLSCILIPYNNYLSFQYS